jgi:hypothetical protein
VDPSGVHAQSPPVLSVHPLLNGHDSNTIIKFSDDTTVVGLITDDDETAYRWVRDLAVWCQDNNLSLNVSKTNELIVYYRKQRAEPFTSTRR